MCADKKEKGTTDTAVRACVGCARMRAGRDVLVAAATAVPAAATRPAVDVLACGLAAGGEHGKLFGQVAAAAVGAGGRFFSAAHEQFAVFAAVVAMVFVNGHGVVC